MLFSFIVICISVGSVVCVGHLIFFDWYGLKKERETEEWIARNCSFT